MPSSAIFGHFRGHSPRCAPASCVRPRRSPKVASRSSIDNYVGTLERWGIYRDGLNPVARSNVCPEIAPPATPSFHAFSYTMPARLGTRPSFVIAGVADATEGKGSYRERTIRLGDTSPRVCARSPAMCSASWNDACKRSAAAGLTRPRRRCIPCLTCTRSWRTISRGVARSRPGSRGTTLGPPVECFDYEMDARAVARELVL